MAGNEPQFVHFDDVRAFELAAGVSGRPLFGAGAMINLIEFEPGAVVPLHSHPHEQLGIVLRGMQALVVEGVPHELGPMEGYVLPGGVEHSAYCGPEGALVIDIFQPVREDYRERWAPAAVSFTWASPSASTSRATWSSGKQGRRSPSSPPTAPFAS